MDLYLWKVLLVWLVLANLAAFALMGMDKHRARNNRWRVAERTLFLPVIFGGGLGGVLGMKVFRHKTRHWYFNYGFPALLVLWLVLIGWLAWLTWA